MKPIHMHTLSLMLASGLSACSTAQPPEPMPQGAATQRQPRADWLSPQHLRASLRNAERSTVSVPLAAAAVPVALPAGPQLDLGTLMLRLPQGGQASFAQYLADNAVDGLIVVHRGQVVAEQYFHGMTASDTHSWASMSKSIIGLLALQLAHEGRLDLNRPLGDYVPDLAATPFGQATVQHNLDMQVALAYQPALPPDLGLFTAAGLLPPRPGMPGTIHAFLQTPRSTAQAHGSLFYYQNGATEALAWALARITGQPLASLVAERLWQPMGAELPGHYTVDAAGTTFAAGGVSSSLRDAARFGELIRMGGRAGGRQVMATEVVQQVLAAPSAMNQALVAQAGRARHGGTGYANQWWHPMAAPGAVLAAGRFGQRIYVDPANALTIAQFGAYADTRARATSGQSATRAQPVVLRTDDGMVALGRALADRLADRLVER